VSLLAPQSYPEEVEHICFGICLIYDRFPFIKGFVFSFPILEIASQPPCYEGDFETTRTLEPLKKYKEMKMHDKMKRVKVRMVIFLF